ncbi:MAG: class I SAM-dependent methyltransferase [bacterium]|nr:class I SAM-dependent methyltransferase [bacterium]
MNKQFTDLLACPECHTHLIISVEKLSCANCTRLFPIIEGIPVFTQNIDEEQTKLSMKKFHELYDEGKTSEEKLHIFAKKKIKEYFPFRKYLESLPDKKNGRFLELGIGGSIAIDTMTKKGYTIYGIDFSITALKLTKHIARIHKIPCFLVCADIAHPPFKENTFDIIYGGGTLEHLEDTRQTLHQLYRISKKNGFIVNTVPVVSISSLTYRQLSGNIPEVPILKQIFYFIHNKILRTRFMFTGYEKSFMPRTIRRWHKEAGFTQVKTFRYEFTPQLPHFPTKLKPFLQRIEKYRPFWTAINVVGRKA